jgi:hypothetical protein
MKEYICDKCGKKFDKKYNYQVHINRIIPCVNILLEEDKIIDDIKEEVKEKIIESAKEEKKVTNITNELIQKCINELKCAYCNKKFSKKNNVIHHIKNNCKKVKEIENEKHAIFLKLKKEREENKLKEIEKIQEEKDKLEEEKKKIQEERNKLDNEKRLRMLEEQNQKMLLIINELQKNQKKTNKTNKISNIKNNAINTGAINSNINSNNNNTINTQQNITLVGYKEEDLNKIDKSEILTIMKRGFQAPVELTRTIHFNPKYPEFHNIFIPKINERYGMVYTNNKWRLIDKNELVDDIYENKRDFIIQNFDNFVNQLDEFKKKSLKRWLDTDENDDESIINTKEDIKRLLYDNRHLAMDKKRIMDREARKLEIVTLPKKVDRKEICDIKIESISESSDTESNNSDSTYYSNYSYVKSDDENA